MQNTTFVKRSLAIVLGLAASGFAMQACSSGTTTSTSGDNTTGAGGAGGRETTTGTTTTSTGGTGGAGGTGGTGSTSTGSTSTGSTSTGSTSTGSTSTGGSAVCTELTAAAFKKKQADGKAAVYASVTMPTLGTADADSLHIEFYGSGFDPALNGEDTGTFDLSAAIDDNYSTCSRCVLLFEDPEVPGRVFFQKTGTLTIDATSDQLNGKLDGTITNLTLIEVTIDPDSAYLSTPVPNGACVHIASAAFTVTPPVVPATWTCDAAYFGDDACDCGCGAVDVDCADALVGSCDYCDDAGSCNTDACPGTINPTNSAVCTP